MNVSIHEIFVKCQLQVSVVEIGMNILYTKYFPSDTHQGIASMHFEQVFLKGSEYNTLLIASKDTTIYALDASTGLVMTTSPFCAKNPSPCLLMQTLGDSSFSSCFN